MKKLLLLSFVLCTALVHAQTTSLSVDKVKSLPTHVIKEGTEVKGYYVFYISDKIDKKTNEYTLKIFDNNLKELKDIKFQDSKDIGILESSFNGTDLIFLFYNDDERTFEYQVFGADGKKKAFTYRRDLTKKEKAYLEMSYLAAADDEDKSYKGLYPIEGKGFISNMPSREDKDYTFQIDYFSTEKKKQWTYVPTEGAKRFVGEFLGAANGLVYLQVMKFGSIMDQKPDCYIVGLDLETGKQVFENKTDGKYRFFPISLSQTTSGQAFVYGEFFDPTANVFKDKSLGFAFWNVDTKGKVTSEKYISWAGDMSRFVNVSSKGKIDDIGYMFVHDMVQTADGSIYAIGEGFKKTVSALGVASKFISRGGGLSAMKIKITDMIFIKFDKDFNVKEVKIYEKNDNNLEMDGGTELVSAALLAKLIKYNYGGFDYAYTQYSKDGASFTVCYSDFERGKDYKGSTFNSISYNDGKITTDKIQTKSDATRSWVLPGKQGQVLVVDYYKKAKKLDMHFEKLN
jgi:hypothetical protein